MSGLRIMSSNLLIDRAEPRAFARAIQDASPDILVVQELGPTCARVIEDHFAHHDLERRRDCLGVGIAAHRPIDVETLEVPERSAKVAQLVPGHWEGLSEPLTIIGMHATNPIDWPWTASVRYRTEQFRLVGHAAAASGGRYVVVGDMNATPIWPGYRMLSALGDDAARLAGTSKRTWSYLTTGPRLLRIDHAFVRGIDVRSTSTVPITGTDHDALIVDLLP